MQAPRFAATCIFVKSMQLCPKRLHMNVQTSHFDTRRYSRGNDWIVYTTFAPCCHNLSPNGSGNYEKEEFFLICFYCTWLFCVLQANR